MSLQAMCTAATGMIAQSQQLEVISNNLANVSTDGFKRNRANFEDLLYKVAKMPGAGQEGSPQTPSLGLQFGVGTRISSTQPDFRPGTIKQTNKPLDVAIVGAGFLSVDDGQGGTLYTRSGNLTLNSQGQVMLATATQGYLLKPEVSIPADATNISIGAGGEVTVLQPGSTTPNLVTTLDAVRFQNPEGLLHVGNNLFQATGSSGQPDTGQWGVQGFGTLQGGSLEASNVEPVEELIHLITSQRAFELNSQVIQTASQNLQVVSTLRQ